MTSSLNILVLGVGGNVSQGILKALALTKLPRRTIAACVSPNSAGLYAADRAYISPKALDPAFPGWLADLCRREHIHAVLSGVEVVLDVLAEQAEAIRCETGAVCVVSQKDRLCIGNDKLATARWLAQQGFNFPQTVPTSDREGAHRLAARLGYPLIAKPRHGRRSEGLLELRCEADLDYALRRPDCVIQECLGTPEAEYTAGTISDCDGCLRGTIVLRREILGGTTHRAEAGEFPHVRAEAARIAEALKPLGPLNVQLRDCGGRAVCFELNVRFSGTTPVRARLGFNDVEAAVRHFVLGEPMPQMPEVTRGVMVRYVNELYVDPDAIRKLEVSGTLERSAANAYADRLGPEV